MTLLVLILVSLQSSDPIEAHYAGKGKYFGPERATSQQGLVDDQPQIFHSQFLSSEIMVPVGVYDPTESELEVLPFLQENADLFRGKSVLEIGTGSGILSLYAAEQGAQRVLATDINSQAIAALRNNALSLSANQIEARHVPSEFKGAYSVVNGGEQFDIILSNPPWVINLDGSQNSAVEDTELLVFSLIDGLEHYLAPDGVVIVFCNTYYSHKVLLKYAKSKGFTARGHTPNRIMPWEAEALLNSYSKRLEETSGTSSDSLQFRWQEELELATVRLKSEVQPPLMEGNSEHQYSGMIILSHKN